jgi:hypothetical protein
LEYDEDEKFYYWKSFSIINKQKNLFYVANVAEDENRIRKMIMFKKSTCVLLMQNNAGTCLSSQLTLKKKLSETSRWGTKQVFHGRVRNQNNRVLSTLVWSWFTKLLGLKNLLHRRSRKKREHGQFKDGMKRSAMCRKLFTPIFEKRFFIKADVL